MLKTLIPLIMLLPMTWFIPFSQLWFMSLFYSLVIAFFSLTWLFFPGETQWSFSNMIMATDPISNPLLILTYWLLPLMIIASQKHISNEPESRQRIYLSLLISLEIFLILAFTMKELLMFFIMFETTLIPTLMIITRWGAQMERLNAGVYFLFYTLIGSMPLLIALLITQNSIGSLSLLTLSSMSPNFMLTLMNKFWWLACLLAFLVKLPLYGVHLWLPKAHLEAPIAGSMILAAVLLKLGGYGMIRMMPIMEPFTKELSYPFIILALWGVIMTSSICLRQTDLKSLIAYSSVSHMGLVIAGILIQTPWSYSGALALMIAHGLTSSALFCLANTSYERTHSRTMLMARGMQMILPLMTSWWFISSLANLAIPPLPNFLAELLVVTSLFNWSPISLLFTGMGILLTANYTLFMFLTTQRGQTPLHLNTIPPTQSREHLLMALHLTPLLTLSLKPELIMI